MGISDTMVISASKLLKEIVSEKALKTQRKGFSSPRSKSCAHVSSPMFLGLVFSFFPYSQYWGTHGVVADDKVSMLLVSCFPSSAAWEDAITEAQEALSYLIQ